MRVSEARIVTRVGGPRQRRASEAAIPNSIQDNGKHGDVAASNRTIMDAGLQTHHSRSTMEWRASWEAE